MLSSSLTTLHLLYTFAAIKEGLPGYFRRDGHRVTFPSGAAGDSRSQGLEKLCKDQLFSEAWRVLKKKKKTTQTSVAQHMALKKKNAFQLRLKINWYRFRYCGSFFVSLFFKLSGIQSRCTGEKADKDEIP